MSKPDIRRFLLRILNALRPFHPEPDLARELASHLALLEDDYVRRGMTRQGAHRAARLALGGIEQTKELHRDARSFVGVDDLRRDVIYAARTLARAPAFTTVAILTLALGIGANTAVFSITHAVLLRPLPYHQPDRLVAVWDRIVREQGMSKLFVQYRDLQRWQERSRSFEQLAGVTWATADRILTGHGAPRNVLAIPATTNLFTLLRVPARLGRTFAPEDLNRGCTLVLTHRSVVYQPLAQKAALTDVYLLVRSPDPAIGASLRQAIARIDAAVVVGQAEPAQRLIDRYVAHPRFRAALLTSLAVLALLLAAAGLYAVLSQVVARRTHEIGVRMTLGARSAEVMRLVLRQSAVLTAGGIAIGLAGAAAVTHSLGAMLFGVKPLEPRTFAAAAAVFTAAAAAASVAPVRRATRVDPLVAIRSE